MIYLATRRRFLKTAGTAGALFELGDLSFLSRLPRVSAKEARLDSNIVRFHPDMEPLVRLLEETPRSRLLEEIGVRIRRGLSYRELLAALLLAGVRNIQPQPVGFKFHAVLVVNSAHLASISSPDSDRWLPIFWALDYFKSAQAQDAREGDWTMAPVDESKVPASHLAKQAFIAAMDNWDESAADAAVTGLARTAGAHEVFEVFCRYGARDFREIGHKAIYVANSWRTLQAIGWQHAEPVLRSLAYGLLDRGGPMVIYNLLTNLGNGMRFDEAFERARQRIGRVESGMTVAEVESALQAMVVTEQRGGAKEKEKDAPRQKFIEGLLCRRSPSPLRQRWLFGFDEDGVELVGFVLEFQRDDPEKEKWVVRSIDRKPADDCPDPDEA